MKFEKHLSIDSDKQKAVDVLKQATDFSKQRIKQIMAQGAVWLTRNGSTQRLRRADKLLSGDDTLHIYYDEELLAQQPDDAILVADEGLYSIWHKPYGMLSQGSKWGDHFTINRWVEKHHQPQRPAFIVHRLDRAATGLIIIAHKKQTAAYFAKLFQTRDIEKRYQAIVHGLFGGDKTVSSPIDGKPALSHIHLLKYDKTLNQSRVEVRIETGRKHQIRRHLSESGFPIVGDRLYGLADENSDKNLCLSSCYLSFASPNDDEIKIYHLAESLLPKLR